METSALLTASILITFLFGIFLWLIIFLNTYRHFPKMEKSKRINLSVLNATIPTVTILALILFVLWIVLNNIK